MALEGWLVGFGVLYEDGGAPAKLDLLSKATSAAAKQFDALTLAAKAAQDSIFGLADVARASGVSVGTLDTALRASAGSSDLAAAAARSAAAGYAATGSAADLAAISIGKYDLALSRAGRSGGGGHGGFGGGVGIGGFVGGAAGGAMLGGPAGAASGLAIHAAKIGAEIGAGYAVDALYEAGHYATTLQAIANVTGAKPWQMDQIRNLTFDQASKTAMSPIESAKMFLDVARQTPSLSIGQKEMLMPYLGKSSVVLGATRGMSPEQVSEAMVSMVHLFQLYKPDQMQKGFDLFTRSGEMMGVSLNRALTQYSYFVPLAQSLGVPQKQDVAIMAELANMGMGKQRGGTGVQRFLQAGIGIRPGDKMTKAVKALSTLPGGLGILDAHGQANFYKNGQLDALGMLSQLAKDRTRMGGALYGQTIMDAYTQNGAKTVLALTTAVQNEQRKATVGRLNQNSLGLDAQYHTLMDQFDPTVKQATKNFQALATEVGSLMLPAATTGFRELGDAMHDGQVWLHQNKNAERLFMRALVDDVDLLGRTFRNNEKSFRVIASDFTDLAKGANLLMPAAMKGASALLLLGRAVADIGSGNWADLGTIGSEIRAKNVAGAINQLPTHDARVNAWNAYLREPGNNPGDLPPHVLEGIRNRPTGKGGGWGALTGPMPPTGPRRAGIPMVGPQPSFGRNFMAPGAVTVNVDARGMSPEEAKKAVADGTKKGLKEALGAPFDPRHTAGSSASIHTSPYQPTHKTTP